MTRPASPSRRQLLGQLAIALSLVPVATRRAIGQHSTDAPLLQESDPAAMAVHYVEEARRAAAATPGASCLSCSVYSAPSGAIEGACTLFPGKSVKAAGWCSSWSGL